MKYFLIFLAIFVLTQGLSAQQPYRWSQLHGPNVGGNYKIMWGVNDQIIALGTGGYLLSENEGRTWDSRPFVIGPFKGTVVTHKITISPGGEYYYYVSSNSSADTAFVGLYQSFDHGYTWLPMVKKLSVLDAFFGTDGSFYIFTSNNSVYRTIDKGKSWLLLSNTPAREVIGANSKYIFYYDYPTAIKYSLDASTVETVTNIPPGYPRGEIMLSNGSLLWYSDSVLYTTDGTTGWGHYSDVTGLTSIFKTNRNTLIANRFDKSDQFYLVESTDNGISWNLLGNLNPPLGQGAVSFNMENPDKLLYETYPQFPTSALYISKDKSNSWKEIGFRFMNVEKVLVTDNSTILVSSYTPSSSNDLGETWQVLRQKHFEKGPAGTVIGVYEDTISILDNNISAVWKKRSVLQYIKGGTTNSPYITSNTNYIFLSNGNSLYRSNDTAFSWSQINVPNTGNPISSLASLNDGTIYYGASPVIYRSSDNGATWEKLIPIHDIVTYNCLKTFGSKTLLLGTQGYGLQISTDRGDSWNRADANNFDSVYYVAVDSKGSIAASTEKGLWIFDVRKNSWEKQILNGDPNLGIGGIDVSKNDEFYVGTNGASLWFGTLNYNGVSALGPHASDLMIFPNPATDKIYVVLPPETSAHPLLEVFDVMGRKLEVDQLENVSGAATIELNMKNLPNGIYTAVLNGRLSGNQKFLVNHQ